MAARRRRPDNHASVIFGQERGRWPVYGRRAARRVYFARPS